MRVPLATIVFLSLLSSARVAYTDPPLDYPDPMYFWWLDPIDHLYWGWASPTGPAMAAINPGPDKKRSVMLYGPGHVFDCDVTYKDGTASTSPSIGNLTSPLGPISNVISLSMSQYMNSPTYYFDVRFTGAIPTPPALPSPGAAMSVRRFKSSTWSIAATADVEITTSYMGMPMTTTTRLTGTNLSNLTTINQLDSERPYALNSWDLPEA